MSEAPPLCRRSEDIALMAGGRVRVVGDYVEVDARRRPRPPARFVGHAAISLEDGGRILLEPNWAPAALRSAGERTRFAGRRVEAVGLLWASSPEPPEPIAYKTAPCLSPVESVVAAD